MANDGQPQDVVPQINKSVNHHHDLSYEFQFGQENNATQNVTGIKFLLCCPFFHFRCCAKQRLTVAC